MQLKKLKQPNAIYRRRSGPRRFIKTLATGAGLLAMILILASLSACAAAPKPITATGEILARIPAVKFNAGSAQSPCFADLDGNGHIDEATEILPDPYNSCDTPETIDGILRTNAALDAAKRASGVPVD